MVCLYLIFSNKIATSTALDISNWIFFVDRDNLVSDITSLWADYPVGHAQMSFMLKFFFIIQMSYWLHCYPELYFQKVCNNLLYTAWRFKLCWFQHITLFWALWMDWPGDTWQKSLANIDCIANFLYSDQAWRHARQNSARYIILGILCCCICAEVSIPLSSFMWIIAYFLVNILLSKTILKGCGICHWYLRFKKKNPFSASHM